MRINNVIPQVNSNNNSKPSFGMVSFHKRISGWHVALSKQEPDIVSIEGFADFMSKNAEYLSNEYYMKSYDLFLPENYKEVRKRLNAIVREAKKELPSFTDDLAAAIRKPFRTKKPEISHTTGHVFIGEIGRNIEL